MQRTKDNTRKDMSSEKREERGLEVGRALFYKEKSSTEGEEGGGVGGEGE